MGSLERLPTRCSHVITNMHTPESNGTALSVQSQGGLTIEPTNFYYAIFVSIKRDWLFDFVSVVPEYNFTNSALVLKKLSFSMMSQSPYVSLA